MLSNEKYNTYFLLVKWRDTWNILYAYDVISCYILQILNSQDLIHLHTRNCSNESIIHRGIFAEIVLKQLGITYRSNKKKFLVAQELSHKYCRFPLSIEDLNGYAKSAAVLARRKKENRSESMHIVKSEILFGQGF